MCLSLGNITLPRIPTKIVFSLVKEWYAIQDLEAKAMGIRSVKNGGEEKNKAVPWVSV